MYLIYVLIARLFSFSTVLTTNGITLVSVLKCKAVPQSTSELHKSSNFIFKCFKQIVMQSKILLFALSVAAFSSCSTAYKTGQTPDDVYYSPAKVVEVKQKAEDRNEGRFQPKADYEITMGIRDRRWRDFRDDYDYDNSPYNYCVCNCRPVGYYYNPYYYPWAIYNTKVTYSAPVNSTPRMVNLNAYSGYNTRVASGKTNGTLIYSNNATQYNNSNRSGSRIGNLLRQTIEPSSNGSSNNNTRSYSPSSGSSGRSSSGSSGSGSGSVSRPGRGG
jgi:uncharacterized membrane protein YgcG